jgi:hypothetical protein
MSDVRDNRDINDRSYQDWHQRGSALAFGGSKDYAQTLIRKRQQWAEFNARQTNVDLRHQINKLFAQLIDGWCEEFDVPHAQPWFSVEFWPTLHHEIQMNYTPADGDPLALDGKYRPRPEGSKYSCGDSSPREFATKPPKETR